MTIEEIEKELPNGFHDAVLTKIAIDYEKRKIMLEIEVNISKSDLPDEVCREASRAGRLTLSGLLFCVIESPDPQYRFHETKNLWISDSGSVKSLKIPARLPTILPNGAFVHYFFVNDWNAFIYLAAMDALFEWS
ncbi:MAG: hypothetical protein Q8M71_01290 [Thermodesulfovibrionales bacterium]|nr:hypothetical protein [Thermodesulfovibrionales bacterium]